MEAIFLWIIYITLGGSCFYLIMCADPNKSGIAGLLNRMLFIHLPHLFKTGAPKLIGQRGVNLVLNGLNYIAYKNHPLIQIMYLALVTGGFIMYIVKGFWEHFPNRRLSYNHYYMAYVITALSLWVYYKVCSVSPGVITKNNIKNYLKKYNRYDGYLFLENNTCKTCNFVKPARSKHCRVCDCCVARFDHHCVWVKQCIGEKNYKYFLLFIVTHVILCYYATFVGVTVFYGIVKDQRLLDISYKLGGEVVKGNIFIAFQFIFHRFTAFFCIVLICIVMGVTLTIFLLYHCSMIAEGTTTNERIKKSDIAFALKKELRVIDEKIQREDIPENKKALEKERKELCKEFENIENYFPKGFWNNLKEIIRM